MDLQKEMSRQFGAAKWCWLLIVALQAFLLAASIGSLWVTTRKNVLSIGVLLLVIPFATFFLKWRAEDYYARGEKLRRFFFFQDSLGHSPERKDLLVIESESTSIPSLDPHSIGDYFTSPSQRGLLRLLENLQESSFYTQRLARLTSRFCAGATAIGGLIAAIVLWVGVQIVPLGGGGVWGNGERIARTFCELFGFFATGIFAELWLNYSRLSDTADHVFQSCDALKSHGPLEPYAIFRQLGNYDCALANGRPIPGVVKWLAGSKLARAWSKHGFKLGSS